MIMRILTFMTTCRVRLIWIAIGAALFAGCGMEASQDSRIAQDLSNEMSCPKPSVKEYRAWGKSGVSVGCRIDHGPFVAVEGYLRVRGQYESGRKVGRWEFYDQDGKVYKEVDYSEGDQDP